MSDLAVVALGANGRITLAAGFATVDVTVDVVGWYSADTQSWGYRYAPDGLRVAKTPPGGTGDVSFTWDRASGLVVPIAEKSPLGGATQWVYGPGGVPVEQIGADGTVVWLHHDQLGSTRAVTDAAGVTVATFSWDPYGNPVGRSGSIDVRVGYAGQYTDRETGLVYLRARHYDPTTGAFLSRDPLVGLTRSAYGYVYGSPLNATDPSGLVCLSLRCARRAAASVVTTGVGAATNVVSTVVDVGDHIDDAVVAGGKWAWEHKATIATVTAVGVCVVGTVGTCAAFSVGALAARSWEAIDRQGWEQSKGDIAVDAGLTYLTLGVAGVADEGLKITGPIVIGGVERAPASPGLKWLGRGLLGTWDSLAAHAQHLGSARC